MIEKLFSPKQVARALGVSESSLKRWCDRGLINTRRTGGGHRRITLSGVCRFLREHDQELVHPDLLGLPATSGRGERCLLRAQEHLLQAIGRGDEEACREVTLDLYLAGFSVEQLCDELLAKVMHRVGESWQCGELEIYQERLGCEILGRILDDLRQVIPTPEPGVAIAIGGAPQGDPYTLAGRMVELVLRAAGWHAVSLGCLLPFPTLAQAVRQRKPRLFWLSVSTMDCEERFLEEYGQFQAAVTDGTAIVVGGRALTEPIRHQMKYCSHCENLQQLKEFSATLWSC